ncbi:MAG TPA: bifunctional phosphoribosylaminoimidazolecarboxamide formyltransferase/IMP cyclohydrolase [Phycisphaerales bacterium]|nr:bifunctional phosphoribosylaminoimidazolecarboxamide formyltransferase/IMP cyclohydrolase [Phycisphaerales bacterium]
MPIRRALLSVSDKSDLLPFARALIARGVTLLSTGGTAKALAAAGIPVTPVETVTQFPEGLDGRVKTLHPAIHAGLLALRDNPEHTAFLAKHHFHPIDLVCINLYPFQQTIADPNVSYETAIENIDIGGPAMLRAAAKNHRFVTVLTSPSQYDRVIQEMDAPEPATEQRPERKRGGSPRPPDTLPETRAELAAAAFARTAEYDAAIASYLSRRAPTAFPSVLDLRYTKLDQLRYGENPHQEAALYRDPASTGQTIPNATQLHGKQLSYNNINDAAAALEVVKALARLSGGTALQSRDSAAVVIKHTNPCGGAVASTTHEAIGAAIAGDPLAAYGGILACSTPIDLAAAKVIADPKNFLEVIVAPSFSDDALALLRERWTQVRLLAVGSRLPSSARKLDYKSIPGGMLVQDRDSGWPGRSAAGSAAPIWHHAAGPKPSDAQLHAAQILETLCRFVTSNAIVLGGSGSPNRTDSATRLYGLGSGQVDRVSACRLAIEKAGPLARGSIAVGDAFFPFPDGPQLLINAGVSMIVHPGGSKRDQETLDLCQTHGVTCMTTGVRHFRH